jgi:methionyl aminopeptidase
VIATTQKEIETLREAGKRMAEVVADVVSLVVPGISSWKLEEAARASTKRLGALPAYLQYQERKGDRPYPTALCVSIDDEIAHSPPRPDKILLPGSVVSIDFGLSYEGFFMDTAYTVGIAKVDTKAANLIKGTKEALDAGISAARAGGHLGDIGAAVSGVAKKFGLGVVRDLRGHGVGAAVHELPYVNNFGRAGTGEIIPDGLVIAIEPLFAEGSGALIEGPDGFAYCTRDHSRAAHFEHTVLLTKEGLEILTA